MPVETSEMFSAIIAENAVNPHQVDVVSNPEFLREGSAIADFMHPDRIVIGTSSPQAEATMRDLYAPLDAPFVFTDVRTSEMIKYAANAFLATKISFMNEIANICELVGVDVKAVAKGIGYDRRIGDLQYESGDRGTAALAFRRICERSKKRPKGGLTTRRCCVRSTP